MTDEAAFARILTPVPPTKPSALRRLADMRARMPAAADLVLVGDSLAAGFPPALIPLPSAEWRAVNLGLPGDRVQNTLWRLKNIPTQHLRPRVAILLLGTNNLGDGDPADAIAAGILSVLRCALALWGGPRAILVTVPRRGEPPGFREADRLALNQALANRAETVVTILDADAALTEARGEAPSLLPDLLHVSEAGYARLGVALEPLLGKPS